MTQGKHTPGPWRVSYERGNTQIRTADNTSIMSDETYYPWVPDNPSDWDLIAAAPEMLEALHNMVELARPYMRDDVQLQALQDARAAITKATGDSQ